MLYQVRLQYGFMLEASSREEAFQKALRRLRESPESAVSDVHDGPIGPSSGVRSAPAGRSSGNGRCHERYNYPYPARSFLSVAGRRPSAVKGSLYLSAARGCRRSPLGNLHAEQRIATLDRGRSRLGEVSLLRRSVVDEAVLISHFPPPAHGNAIGSGPASAPSKGRHTIGHTNRYEHPSGEGGRVYQAASHRHARSSVRRCLRR